MISKNYFAKTLLFKMCLQRMFVMWIFLVKFSYIEGYNILVVFPIPAGSHRNLGDGYVRNLLKAGHEVTYITPFPYESPDRNLRLIATGDTVNAISGPSLNITALMLHEVEMDQDRHFKLAINITKNTLKNKAVQKLLHDPSEKFDLVVAEWMFNDVYCGFSAVFNCPYIWSFPYESNSISLGLLGEFSNPAYTANIETSDVPLFDFWQRIYSLWFRITSRVQHLLYYENIEKDLYKEIFSPILTKRGKTLPPYNELRYNASFVLGNTDPSIGQTLSLPQNYIPIAGYHIDEVKPLPQDLSKILDNAKHGVIYFSLGSNLKSKDFPEEILQDLLKLFGELQQTVLWKFEESLPNKPANVHILKWAPQQSILAHRNCNLFITHGGMLSVTEAVHFAVPFIGIPVFYDQNFNVAKSVQRGIAKKVTLNMNLAKNLREAVHEMLSNNKYREAIKMTSLTYHNRMVPRGDELVHWIEYAVRTNGAPHYRSAALLLSWYQKCYLDFIILIIIAFICLFVYLLKLLRIKKVQKIKSS